MCRGSTGQEQQRWQLLTSLDQGAQISPHGVHLLHSKQPECSRFVILLQFINAAHPRCIRLIFCAVQENLPTCNESSVSEMNQIYNVYKNHLNMPSRPNLNVHSCYFSGCFIYQEASRDKYCCSSDQAAVFKLSRQIIIAHKLFSK